MRIFTNQDYVQCIWPGNLACLTPLAQTQASKQKFIYWATKGRFNNYCNNRDSPVISQ